MIIFEKEYDISYEGESLSDVGRDVMKCFETRFNPLVKDIPQDEYGFCLGTYKITVEWEEEEE